MTSEQDETRIVRAWLEDGVTVLPDRVLDDVLAQLPATRQSRPLRWGWKASPMDTALPFGLAAVVIVAQRVSTISTADNIIVLEDGEIVGAGTHEELLHTCPTYAEIVESQIGEKDAA